MTKALSTSLSARSNGLDDIDGGPERRVYTQMRGVEQVRVRRGFEGGRGAPGIPFVAPQQVGQDLLLVGGLAAGAQFKGAAGSPHFRARHDKKLHIGAGRYDRADIAAVEHRARRLGRESALVIDQGLA